MSERYRDFSPRIDVEAFLRDNGVLEDFDLRTNKQGQVEMVGQCPDPWSLHKHGDTTGKFAVNVDKKVYNCFVCGGGSLLSLAMAVRDEPVEVATEHLRIYAGDERAKSDDQWANDMYAMLDQLVAQPEPTDTMPWFNRHDLSKYDVYWDNLMDWNEGVYDGKPKNISVDVLYDCGVCFDPEATKYAPRNRQREPIDKPYTGPCVIFPHTVDEQIVGWQHRWLSDMRPKWVSKYTNTPDFPKATTLYRPFPVWQSHLPVVVVESVPTALYVVGHGWPAVATFGATATPAQMKLLRRFQQGVVIAPDNDKPGIEGLLAMANYLEGFIPVSFIEPDGESGDDLLDRGQTQDIERLLRTAVRLS